MLGPVCRYYSFSRKKYRCSRSSRDIYDPEKVARRNARALLNNNEPINFVVAVNNLIQLINSNDFIADKHHISQISFTMEILVSLANRNRSYDQWVRVLDSDSDHETSCSGSSSDSERDITDEDKPAVKKRKTFYKNMSHKELVSRIEKRLKKYILDDNSIPIRQNVKNQIPAPLEPLAVRSKKYLVRSLIRSLRISARTYKDWIKPIDYV